MRISMLKLKNCLGIKELEFKPGQITIIEGEEGQGKTSILESIQRFFWNKSERKTFIYTDDEGPAEKAETYIDLDDGTVMKKYINKENKVTTIGINRDDMSPRNPETFLKSLVNENQLNPISLINMDDKELTNLILSLMPINVTENDVKEWLGEVPQTIDYNKHGLQVCKDLEKYYFDKRTEVNRRIKDLEAVVKAETEKLPEEYDPDKWRNVSLTEKYEAIKATIEENRKLEQHKLTVNNLESTIEGYRNKAKAEISEVKQKAIEDKKDKEDEINKLKQRIAILESELVQVDTNCTNKIKEITDKYKKLADEAEKEAEESKKYIETHSLIDIKPLEDAHKEAELMKSYIRTADDLKVKKEELASKKKESENLTNKIEYMRTKPQMLLSKAQMPIEGITVDNQGNILISNRPIINLSGGERIKLAVNIARAAAGPLKTILINGFEALSPKAQQHFIEECTGDGYQYIITKVTNGELRIVNIDDNGNKYDALTGEVLEG